MPNLIKMATTYHASLIKISSDWSLTKKACVCRVLRPCAGETLTHTGGMRSCYSSSDLFLDLYKKQLLTPLKHDSYPFLKKKGNRAHTSKLTKLVPRHSKLISYFYSNHHRLSSKHFYAPEPTYVQLFMAD